MANGLLDFEIRIGLKKTIFRYDATDKRQNIKIRNSTNDV